MSFPSDRAETIFAAAPFALGLAFLADALTYGQIPGLGLAALTAAGGVAILVFRRGAARRRLTIAGGLSAAAVAPLIENVSLLSFLVALTLLAAAAIVASDGFSGRLFAEARRLFSLALLMPAHAVIRLLALAATLLKWRGLQGGSVLVANWIMPVMAGLVFLALFAVANPLIEQAFEAIDIEALLRRLSPVQIIFWIVIAGLALALLLPPALARHAADTPAAAEETGAPDLSARLFGEAAILRALILFNLLFLVQNVSDLLVLWTGLLDLPPGLTYAGYAHRGAYPLMVTAALAALFTLATLRPGSAAADNQTIRALNGLWVAQNVVLTAASMHRLALYVDAYGLTHWRISAFLWMGLVATGLVLIVVRIATNRSGAWLFGTNLATAGAVLYCACFIDFSAMIATHNLARARAGRAIDLSHLELLGPSAIPAIETHLAALAGVPPTSDTMRLVQIRDIMTMRLADLRSGWRSDSLRMLRLSRQIAGDGRLCDLPLYRATSACSGGRGR